ncbi:MAG: hypothetical protein KF911_12110 [Pseudomonadales bacterium]|nr:hypothetical protein [Pseudomonadales bacterium]
MDTTSYVLCIDNTGYPAALELRKVYLVLADEEAARHDLLRVIDESGEDYLYPASMFVPIDLPERASRELRSKPGHSS